MHRQNVPIQVLFLIGFIVTLFTLKQSCCFFLWFMHSHVIVVVCVTDIDEQSIGVCGGTVFFLHF